MRIIMTIAVATGLVLMAGIVGFWTTSLPADTPVKSSSVDSYQMTLKAKHLPDQQIESLY